MGKDAHLAHQFLRDWQKACRPRGNDAGFYQILQELDQTDVAPDATATIGIVGQTREEDHLLSLWQAWGMFIRGQEEQGLKLMLSVARKLSKRPESWIFLGCATLIQTDKATAYDAFAKAQKLDPHLTPLNELLQSFGVRSKPVIPFLHRDNPLNISLGKMRAKRQRKQAQAG